MEAVREKWTDERLDDLNSKADDLGRRMDHRFDAVDRRFDSIDRRFEGIDRRFERIDTRLDSMNRVMIQGFVAMGVALATGFLTLAGLIVGH
jgi:hypothetical protein